MRASLSTQSVVCVRFRVKRDRSADTVTHHANGPAASSCVPQCLLIGSKMCNARAAIARGKSRCCSCTQSKCGCCGLHFLCWNSQRPAGTVQQADKFISKHPCVRHAAVQHCSVPLRGKSKKGDAHAITRCVNLGKAICPRSSPGCHSEPRRNSCGHRCPSQFPHLPPASRRNPELGCVVLTHELDLVPKQSQQLCLSECNTHEIERCGIY